MTKNIYLLFSFTWLCALTTYAQVPSAGSNIEELSGLSKSPTTAVSHYTGRPNISVPLYSLAAAGLVMPIGLQYDAAGVRVENNRGGLVGLNWTLQAGNILHDYNPHYNIRFF